MLKTIAAVTFCLALAVGLDSGPAAAQEQSRPAASEMSDAEREVLRNEIRTYLLEHPEVLMEAIRVLEARRDAESRERDAQLIAANLDQLINHPTSWVGGNPEGDVTLVEFLDYRCGYCKRAHPEVQALLASDLNIRYVVKEFPILGPESTAAGRMAEAALDLDPSKYGELQNALMSFGGQLTEAIAYQIASHVGYDIAALKERAANAEIEARIADTYALARTLGLEGTPSFIVGNRIIRGYVPLERMTAMIAEAREATN